MKVFSQNHLISKHVRLDETDRKILSYLGKNSRLPYNKLGKWISLSRQKIAYRVQMLKKHGVLMGSRTVINADALGFQKYHYFVNVATRNEHDILVNRCLEHDYVNALLTYSGKWSMEISIMAQSQAKCQKVFNELTHGLTLIKHSVCTLIATHTNKILPKLTDVKLPASYRNDSSFHKDFDHKKIIHNPDNVDKKIMTLLSVDANMSLMDIGKKVDLSNDAIRYRVKKLIHSKHILAFIPRPNFEVLGYTITVIIFNVASHSGDHYRSFHEFLHSQDIVLWAASCLGDWNYIVYLVHENIAEVHNFLEEAQHTFAKLIINYEILYGKAQFKYLYLAPAALRIKK